LPRANAMTDILLTPIVFLLTAVLLVPLAQRLGLGSVLGYLIGGCLIGPWGLGLVADVEKISHVAEIGVVLMLFLIGLELQPRKLVEMRTTVLGGGTLQMAACGGVLAGCAWLLGMGVAAAAVAGLALALSSTAIVVQNMAERHISNTAAGKSAFAVLLFQDMAAIPLLVAVPLLGAAKGGAQFNWLLAVAVLAAVLVAGRYAMPAALRLMARTRLPEVFTAFALLLVLGIAQLMTLASLSMGLGAFLAGVLLAGSEYRKALEADLEPFKGLLLGLFFTSVGMAMNLGLLASSPLLIALLTLAYMLVKMFLLALVARAMPVPALQRWTFAGLLAQGSEFAFVLLVLVVAVSMALTPLALMGAQRLTAFLHKAPPRPPDHIEPEGARVIIAGFGRVGQIAGRLLAAAGTKVTVLDNDPDLIDMLRRFGFRVFYGDATRLDLLHAAGAHEADILINAIDDMQGNLALTDLARQHFPNLQIVARARNVTHVFELRSRGVQDIERETFESSLLLGRHALLRLGVAPDEVARLAARFRDHNLSTLDAIFPHYRDEATMISIAQAARNELEQSIEQDRLRLSGDAGH
jgi:glutathione-regulated potassium-efflux system ancillary protein KefC